MLSLLFKLNIYLFIDLLELVNLFLKSYSIFFQHIIYVSALFALVKLQSCL